MNVTADLRPILPSERPVLERMFQLYLYDMSEFMGWPVALSGQFELPRNLLNPYWNRDDHWPYFIAADEELAGFSLVRKAPDDASVYDMGQFFVMRKFRGGGVAQSAFSHSVQCHPGAWQVRVFPANIPAVRFWRKAIKEVAQAGQTEERVLPYGDVDMRHLFFRTSDSA